MSSYTNSTHSGSKRSVFGPELTLTIAMVCGLISSFAWSMFFYLLTQPVAAVAVAQAVVRALSAEARDRRWNVWVAFHALVFIGCLFFPGNLDAILALWIVILSWPTIWAGYKIFQWYRRSHAGNEGASSSR